jgi:hypothetical protein
MKSTFFALLLCSMLAGWSQAGFPIFVDVKTDTTGTRYALNAQPKTLDEIESFLTGMIHTFTEDGIYSDGIFVRPDARTSFVTVFELLQRFKKAGVNRCEVIGSDTSTEAVLEYHSLVVSADSLRHKRFELLPPAEPAK